MELLTAQDRARLLANGALRRQAEQDDPDVCIDAAEARRISA